MIDSKSEGISLGPVSNQLGFNSIPIRDVYFKNCRVPQTNLLGQKGKGFKIAMKLLQAQRINIGINDFLMR